MLNNEWITKHPKEKKGEYVRWSDRSQVLKWKLPKNPHSLLSGRSAEELGTENQEYRIYVYLLDTSDVPICFWHGKLSEFMDIDAKWKWIQLKPNRSYAKIENDQQAGMVSVKISVNRPSQLQAAADFRNYRAWRDEPPQRIGTYNLRVFIFQAKDLPVADSDGSSDPFIKIFNLTGEDVVTSVIEDNLNPIFMEVREVAVDF